MSTPQTRTLEWLRKAGYIAQGVEKLVRFPDKRSPRCHSCGSQKMVMVRKDLFGFVDIVAVHPDFNETVFVQSTDATNVAKRVAKILSAKEAPTVLAQPGRRVLVVGWSKKGPRGKRKLWKTTIREIKLLDSGELTVLTDT